MRISLATYIDSESDQQQQLVNTPRSLEALACRGLFPQDVRYQTYEEYTEGQIRAQHSITNTKPPAEELEYGVL